MNKRVLFLLLTTSFFSIQASAMYENPNEPETGSSHSVKRISFTDAYRELSVYRQKNMAVDGERGKRRQGRKENVGKLFEDAKSSLCDSLTLESLANAVHISRYRTLPPSAQQEAYLIFINGNITKNPFRIISLLGYQDICEKITEDQWEVLRKFKFTESDGGKTFTRVEYEANGLGPSPNTALQTACVWAEDRNLSTDAKIGLLIYLTERLGATYIPELLKFADDNTVHAELRGQAYYAAAVSAEKEQRSTYSKTRVANSSAFDNARFYYDTARNLLKNKPNLHRAVLSAGSSLLLFLKENNMYRDDALLLSYLREEVSYGSVSDKKVRFLAEQARKTGNIKLASSYFSNDQQSSYEYAWLLYLDGRYQDIREILPTFYHHPDLHLAAATYWKLKDREKFIQFFSRKLYPSYFSPRGKDNFRELLNPLSDEIMGSELAEEVKANFAYAYNTVNQEGFELASQLSYVQNPKLQLFLSIPLFNGNPTPNEGIITRVNDLLKENPGAAISLLDTNERLTVPINELGKLFKVLSNHYKGTPDQENINRQWKEAKQYSKRQKQEQARTAANAVEEAAAKAAAKEAAKEAAAQEAAKEAKRLKINFTDAQDPRKNWRYDREAIESGSCNATEEHRKGYQGVANFIKGLVDDKHISKWEAQNAITVIRGYAILHENNAAICRELLESPTLINYSNQFQVHRPRDILLHPESTDTNLEMRAHVFYNILMAAFEFVRSSEDVALQVKFVREAFAPHIPCFEARSRHLDSWRDSAVRGHYSQLQDPQVIASKSARDNILGLANALLEKEKVSIPSARDSDRLQYTKAMFQRLFSHASNKAALDEMNWVLGELQKRLHAESEAAYTSGRTYSLICEQLMEQLVGKAASDKTIEASDIKTVFDDILCWDVDEDTFRPSKKRRVEE